MKYRAIRYITRSEIVLTVGEENRDCTLFCVSKTGACVVGADKLRVNEDVVINYAGGSVTATVKWCNGTKAGVAFLQELSTQTLDRIRFVNNGRPVNTPNHARYTEMR